MKVSRYPQILIAALGLVLISGACQSSQNSPPKSNAKAGSAGFIAPVPQKIPKPVPWPPAEGGEIWHSTTTHKDYRVKIDGDKLYAEWVNLSPIAAENRAYIRTECVRKGSKWVGTSELFLPCTIGSGAQEHIANTCHLKMKVEIDSISKKLIKGRGQTLPKFECASCKVLETGWASFKWVPLPSPKKKPLVARKN